jgi:hypothetical protein
MCENRTKSPDRSRPALRNTGSVPFLLAHLGHWYMWFLYALPAIIVLVATVHSARAQRKARRQGTPGPRYRGQDG